MAETSTQPPVQPLSRRHRERPAPGFDLADKVFALQRKSAGPPRRDRPAAPTAAAAEPNPQSHLTIPQAHQPALSSSSYSTALTPPPPPASPRRRREPEPDAFDRRLPSSNPADPMLATSRPRGHLFNPHTDPIPRRHLHREPDVESDSSSAVDQPTHSRRRRIPQPPPSHPSPALPSSQPQSRQLFDPRRDDPFRFTALTRSTPKPPTGPPSGGYISASATSASDAQSLGSNLTLTSGTTSSSASNPYSPTNGRELGGQRLWLDQMKRMYREISLLEHKIISEGDVVDEDLDSRDSAARIASARASDEKWARLVKEHINLVDLYHGFLSFALKPQVPASLQTLPDKYTIPARLWNHGFQRLLAALRRASVSSPVALEQLGSFIIFAYGFYTSLLEEENLTQFRVLWLEALGDLSRYQMAVVAHLAQGSSQASGSGALSLPAVTLLAQSNSPGVSRMEESLPSIGAHAAAAFEIEDDRELWRRNAREWYTKGIKDTPGQGRLHHHLGLVSADAEGEELRAVYHFAKSLITTRGFDLAKESILPLFSLAKQSSRYQPSSTAPSIFLLMQGMLFTRIQLDDFQPTIARFKERLQLEPLEVTEGEWIMMAVLNITSLLEYGKPEGVLRKVCGWSSAGASSSHGHSGSRPSSSRLPPKRTDAGDRVQSDVVMVDAEPEEMPHDVLSGAMEALSTKAATAASAEELPYTLQLALQLTMEMLLYTMRNPFIRSKSPFRPHSLNPYLTTILTFLATILKSEQAAALLERYVPWTELMPFFTSVRQQTSTSSFREDEAAKSTSKWFGSSPLPEDLCLRGSEWVRRVYDRGFWRSKSEGGMSCEMDVLVPARTVEDDLTDGVVESENDDGYLDVNWTDPRYKRLRWAAESIVKSVDGVEWVGESKSRSAAMGGVLLQKVELWSAERKQEEEAERRRHERTWNDDEEMMEVDQAASDEDDYDDPEDSPEVKALKARRRYLRSLQFPSSVPHARPAPRQSRQSKLVRPALQVAPGYTVLVCDTNILLSSLPLVSDLITSLRWTVIVPLAVVTELDGLGNNTNELGRAAREALNYLIGAVQSHSSSLKVQTSRGNYLQSLSIRSEDTVLGAGERNMDDLIVRSALWQLDHFVDRTVMLKSGPAVPRTEQTSKVVLLTFDRNMRLKARSRQLHAADEKDMATIFSSHSSR